MSRSSTIEGNDINILLVLGVVLAGFVVIGPLVGILLALPFFDGTVMDFMTAISDPLNHPEVKRPFFIVQGASTFVGLIVAPALLLLAKGKSVKNFLRIPPTAIGLYLMVIVATIVFMLVNSPFIEWNATLQFPEFMSSFEEWARTREDFATRVTEFLTTFNSVGELLTGLLVIALLPAIGEEFVFRGLLQPQLHKNIGNIHAAIWISAILFSALHMQFFGFVPRVFLGALFGYLYYWSGNLWIAILAHFVNNGFSVLMLYFYQQGVSELDMNSTESADWRVVTGATIVSFTLLYFFKKQATTARDSSSEI